MVARYLPPDRYEPFVMALFANQDAWMEQIMAYDKGAAKPTEQKAALLALEELGVLEPGEVDDAIDEIAETSEGN